MLNARREERTVSTRIDRIALAAAYGYLAVPVCIFFAGWLRLRYALPCIGAVAVSGVLAYRSSAPFVAAPLDERRTKIALGVIALAALWVFFSGIGGWVFQNWDFIVRNAVLRDLIDLHWPVIYRYPPEPASSPAAGHTGALVYYLAFWLPVALAGKFAGWEAAQTGLYLYAVAGVVIALYLLMRALRRWAAWVALIFIFWSGMDFAGRLVFMQVPEWGEHIEWWAYYFSYPASTSSLYWIFNQAIPLWIATFLLLNQQNGRSAVFTAFLALPYAPLPFVGLIPLVLCRLLCGGEGTAACASGPRGMWRALAGRVARAATFPNIVGALTVGGVFLLYYGSNVKRAIILNQPLTAYARDGWSLAKIVDHYILFCVFEFGILAALIYERFRREPLFIMTVVTLALIPLYCFGLANDFAMRVSMPGLALLPVYAVRFLTSRHPGGGARKWAVGICLFVGAVTAFNEMARPIKYLTLHGVADDIRSFSRIEKFNPGYIALDPGESLFFSKLARRP